MLANKPVKLHIQQPLILVRQDMDVNKQYFYCCSTFHSHSRILNNGYNSYTKMDVKQPLVCRMSCTQFMQDHLCDVIVSRLVISFIGGRNWRKPLTCHKSLTNFITLCHNQLYRVHLAMRGI